MLSRISFVAVSLATVVAPLSAQIVVRDPRTDPRTTTSVDPRTGQVIIGSTGDVSRSRRDKIPPGQLPPRGTCRVWVDGVPPGQQPPVESCAQAEADRARYGANARVIYGDQSSFPGRGKGKFKDSRKNAQCVTRDAVVINGRLVDVCRDANGNVMRTGDDRSNRKVKRDDDDDDDRNEIRGRDDDQDDDRGKLKAAKIKAKGKKGDD